MSEQLVIEKALRNLQTIGCKVGIIDLKGNVYGDYKLVPWTQEVKKKRAKPKHPIGTVSGYLSPYLDILTEPGDVIDIPFSPQFDKNALISSASSYMIHRYGKGCAKSETISPTTFRVFRLDKQND